MKLYPKKLNNIKDLEREKRRLKEELAQLDSEPFLPYEELFDKYTTGENKINSILDFLATGRPFIDSIISFFRNKTSKEKEETECPSEKPGKNIFKSLAIEVLGGYLKWKAVELSFKGVKHLMKSGFSKKKPENNK